MEIEFLITRNDYRNYYEWLWRDSASSQRREYYHTFISYLGILALASFLAWKHEEMLPLLLFGWLALSYLWQNWSCAKHWRTQLDQYVTGMAESKILLRIQDHGITSIRAGVETRVPWSQLSSYTIARNSLLIPFLENHAFIVALSQFSESRQAEIMAELERRNLRRSGNAKTADANTSGKATPSVRTADESS